MFALVFPHISSLSGVGRHGTGVANVALLLYAFSPIALLVLESVRWDRVSLLLVAPNWQDRVLFSDIIVLLAGHLGPSLSSRGLSTPPSAKAVEDMEATHKH